jgi:RNA polymerase sigma factor (sigma-70 family)
MQAREWLTEDFEDNRTHLKSVAYRMLGSLTEAEDAVQEAWLRFSRADRTDIENLRGWLTTVVARVSLNMLQKRNSHREEPFGPHMPEPIVSGDENDPEHEALLADSVGLALLVVLETLKPAERLAFVLHDIFGVSFDEIAPIVERSPAAARQLASRARRRVQASPTVPDADLSRQRAVVDAFVAAAREGDFERLLAVLDPDVVLRSDHPARMLRGAKTVARGAMGFSRLGLQIRPVVINGAAGLAAFDEGKPFSVMACTVVDGRIVEMDVIADPERVSRLQLETLA